MPGKYNWGDTSLPLLDEHSAAKHRVLRAYVENYIQILCLDPRRRALRLLVVDGFCGGGRYQDEQGAPQPGSPILLIQALRNGREKVLRRRKELEIQHSFALNATLHLNDIDPRAIRRLRADLEADRSDQALWMPELVFSARDFADAAEDIIQAYSKGRAPRAIFVLDQYGYTHASLPLMRRIFQAFPHAEIVLTFAIDALANFASTATLDLYRKALAACGFDQFVSAERLAQIKEEEDAAKHVIQTLFLREVFPATNAQFATPFFIMPKESRRGYWLLHLANNLRANDEMKRLHWEIQNHFMHFGAEGVGILAFDPVRLDTTGQFKFDFGDVAQQRTQAALLVDLPKIVCDEYKEGVTINDLLHRLANDTPATSPMIRQQLFELSQSREIDVRTAAFNERKTAEHLAPNDLVSVRRQFRLL